MAKSTLAPTRPQSIAPLNRVENAAGAIIALSELRGHLEDAKHMQGSEHFEFFTGHYGSAIAAGIEALAKSIYGDLDMAEAPAEQAAAPAVRT